MTQPDPFAEELADFVRRVGELKAARSVPEGELPTVLDAALFELDHVAQTLWPCYTQLASAGGRPGTAADRQEQQLLRSVFQRLPVPVALMDRETVVRRMNFAATEFTGVRAGFATGRPLAGLLAHADRAAFRSQAAAVARGEGERSLTVRLQQRPTEPVRATLAPLRPRNEPHTQVMVVLQPADTPLPHAAGQPAPQPDLDETTRHATLLDLVDTMAVELLSVRPGEPDEVLRRAAGVLHGAFADWVIADAGTGHLVRSVVLGPAEEDAAEEGAAGPAVRDVAAQDPAACPLVAEAARGGSAALQVRPEDPEAFGRDGSGAPVLARVDATSLLCVPLTDPADGRVAGVLSLFRTGAARAFSMAEARAVDVMSRHLALALRR